MKNYVNSPLKQIIISDPTLRDGNHAVQHQLTLQDIKHYAQAIDEVGIDIVEVGHGNGLGASSIQLGKSAYSDLEILQTARAALKHTKLGVHIIPGFARTNKELALALDQGVDTFRIAAHCTEADLTARHIEFISKAGREVFGVLMMTHMASATTLLQEATKMQNYGAQAIILMDSAGAYLPTDVTEKVSLLQMNLQIPIGFHAHNNLGMAIANSLAAVSAGATILDATACGFGAGAGNAALEVLVAVLQKLQYGLSIDLPKLLIAIDVARQSFIKQVPFITTHSLLSGLHGVFSGFAKPVQKAATDFNVDAHEIFRLLGERNVVAGQEDLIIEVAKELQSVHGTAPTI